MKVFELLKEGTAILKNSGATDTPRLDSEVLLMHVLGCDKMSLILNDKMSVSFLDEERFFSLLKRRKEREPISYITGEREFMSLKFFVAEGILIPRPDTEVLTEFVIEKAKKIKNAEILDLCTGSGAIAVSVAKYVKDSKVLAVDFSPKCLHFAEKNAKENEVADRVRVLKQDVLADFSLSDLGQKENEGFDILVSNPPYIKSEIIKTLDKDVKDFEPITALDGGADGLVFYRRIAEISPRLLKAKGILAFEIGHDQYDEVYAILAGSGNFKDINSLCDLSGIKRVITAVLK